MTPANNQQDAAAEQSERRYAPGFRRRRGRNWLLLGLTYASYYLCRYNLGIVAPEFKETLGFDNKQYGAINTARNWAHWVGSTSRSTSPPSASWSIRSPSRNRQ